MIILPEGNSLILHQSRLILSQRMNLKEGKGKEAGDLQNDIHQT
jgi:hypothetical protein